MELTLPSMDDVRKRLKALSKAQVDALQKHSGVPVSTIYKIRYGLTPNPGYVTVNDLYAKLPAAEGEPKLATRKRRKAQADGATEQMASAAAGSN